MTLFRRNSYDYQYQLAVKAAADNDADRALKYLSRAMELEPDQTYMWLFKAQIEKDSGDREAAEESCRYILSKLDPDNQEVYTMLIEMYIEEGDLDSVKDTLSRARCRQDKKFLCGLYRSGAHRFLCRRHLL